MLGGYDLQSQMPLRRLDFIRILGTGAADPTKEVGDGVTVTHVSTGRYRFTFTENIGAYDGAFAQFAKDAPAAAAGKLVTVDHDSWTASGLALDIVIEDPGTEAAAPALSDLTSDERLYVWVQFARTSL